MSGFVALFQRNGAPLDRLLLGELTASLSFRGPDAQQTWAEGSMGLGHTLLRSGPPGNDRQPASCDGECWIVCDARLDQRDDLRRELRSAGCNVERGASDCALILRAYLAWNEDCLRRLRGDFAFAIWDGRLRRLFCARDHFGIKPFYYAQTREFFVCSNTLDCVRRHPDVCDELNDDAIADFLLFGLNCNQATTTFKHVGRLPPAHFLNVTAGIVSARRYWSPPVDGRIRYRHEEEYAEHFREHLRAAVADRLEPDRTAIFLSGGLDSGSIAATARDIAGNSGAELKAYTVTYEKLIGDREGHYARQTADFLQIPHEIISMDHLEPFADGGDPEFSFPEPIEDPLTAGVRDQFGAIAQHSRVVLDGEGGDNLMFFELAPYLKDLRTRGELLALSAALIGYSWRQRSRWHRLGFRVARRIGKNERIDAPPWIAPDFARRVNFHERSKPFPRPIPERAHPILPSAHASLMLPQWSRMFELSDAAATRRNIEVRFPFLDLRLVEYLLALPPFPLFLRKKLERDAMKGRLPRSILSRPKAPLLADPTLAAFRKAGPDPLGRLEWDGEIARYVSRKPVFHSSKSPYSERESSCIRAACLNFWLQRLRSVRYNISRGSAWIVAKTSL